MDYHPFKAALNRYLIGHAGGESRPAFLRPGAVCGALDEVTTNYPAIRAECDRLLDRRGSMPRYHDIDPIETEISATVDPDKAWRVFMLYMLGVKPEANRALCPETCRLIDRVPTLVQAFYSILDPGKNIPLHNGPYLGYLRYHLALRVPSADPPTIVVNGQEYCWREGEAMVFDDSLPHQVINRAREPRAVLIIDVLRPLPLVAGLVNRAVIFGIAKRHFRGVNRRVEQFVPTT